MKPLPESQARGELREILKKRWTGSLVTAVKVFAGSIGAAVALGTGLAAVNAFSVQTLLGLITGVFAFSTSAFFFFEQERLRETRSAAQKLLNEDRLYEDLLRSRQDELERTQSELERARAEAIMVMTAQAWLVDLRNALEQPQRLEPKEDGDG